MELDKEKILQLVADECRDLGIYHTAAQAITWIIVNLWHTHGHWNWFEIPGHEKYHPLQANEYYQPSRSTLCLYHCLERIKKTPKRFFIDTFEEISNEQYSARSTDSPQQVHTPTLSIASSGCDRE